MFMWVKLGTDAASEINWFDFGRAHQVLALSGRAFAVSSGTDCHLRLSFANPSVAAVREGIQRLTAGLAARVRAPVAG
jgi:DNA-binding transcriptional MocR family regulator